MGHSLFLIDSSLANKRMNEFISTSLAYETSCKVIFRQILFRFATNLGYFDSLLRGPIRYSYEPDFEVFWMNLNFVSGENCKPRVKDQMRF